MEKKTTKQETKTKPQAQALTLPSQVRGRSFEGTVTKVFPTRVVIEFDRVVSVRKFERFYKKKSKIHARLPKEMTGIKVGDYIKVTECRPLSKIIHHIVVEKIRSGLGENNESN